MLTFDRLMLEEGSPIYLQIVRYVRQQIAGGGIAHGTELPSRRVLSALLGVNPNTVQKAYRILEDEGLIASHTGAKSCVVADDDTRARVRALLLRAELAKTVDAMRRMGVDRPEAHALLDQVWDDPQKGGPEP